MTYTRSARIYDQIYLNTGKDYAAEARHIHQLACRHKMSSDETLLDVACGTGIHVGYLKGFYRVQGVDVSDEMIAVAREKHPDVAFHIGDMRDFELNRQFDVVTCLFSSIGYLESTEMLNLAVANLGKHLKPGGVLFLEPWFTPDTWKSGVIHAVFVDQPGLKISRMNISEGEGKRSSFTFHYLIATAQGVEYFTERHNMTLFTHDEYIDSFRVSPLDVLYEPGGISGRGLYIGKKPLKHFGTTIT
jgi:SAM-dependent methyltransferase